MAGKRRANHEGSVRQRADGRWEAIISLPDGRRKSIYGKTQEVVVRRKTELLGSVQQGLPVPDGRTTVGQFLRLWLSDVARPTIRPRTFESYEMIVNLHLIPAFGKVRLSKLGPQDVQTYMNRKRKEGLSPKTVVNHRAVLRRALGQALKWGLVARNVATLVDPPRVTRHEIEPLSLEEAEKLLQAVRGHRLEALFTVALALGLREGEALGLCWKDVDLDGGMLLVRRQLQRLKGELVDGKRQRGRVVLAETKTDRSRRTIALPAFAVQALREHRVRQLEERLQMGARWKGCEQGELVFPSIFGTPLDARNLIRQYHALLEKAGIPRRRFHDLRHTCATLLLVQGEDLRVVMEVLGHSQITLTANTYQHVVQSLKRGAADKMQALLGGAR